ncbi:glutathione peroxidase 2-like [Amphiura filiformis]|uniref:glutathione peroxidase 2-like n=1 Tax=Amphiura filiformis TaxID=82378 RepID=UPI003B20FFD8
MTGLRTTTQRPSPDVTAAADAGLASSVSQHYRQLLLPVSAVRSFFELSALGIDGKMVHFSKFDKRMVLVANVASGDMNAVREFTQLNDLMIAYGTRGLSIMAFPCNQFGCEPYDDHEIMNCLRHVRPGRNFKPRFHLMGKCDVTGPTTHPVFEYLTQRLPTSSDDARHPENYEISANFEKFLISPDGTPMKRYTSRTRASALAFDIEEVVKRTFPNKMTKSRLNLFEEPDENVVKKFEENGKKRARREEKAIIKIH